MRLLAEIHGYPPHHNSGAEWMAHHIFRHLVKQGHEVRVLLNFDSYLGHVDKAYELDGVKVISDKDYVSNYSWCDMVFTHLDKTGKAYNRAKQFNKPLVHIVHNNYKNVVMENMNGIDQYAIYNTYWVQKDRRPYNKFIKKDIVIHPPVYVDDYKTDKINSYITLINVNYNKGGQFLIDLAKRLPKYKFIGVMGSYGQQAIDFNVKNIHYQYNNPDIKQVYRRTRLLLMPSIYESYGRTAIEACSNGIPVICTPTPGLQEALGEAGIYIERNIELWASKIKQLDNEKTYNIHSELALKRANEVNPDKELKVLTKFIENVSSN